jgi:hypothetical protein
MPPNPASRPLERLTLALKNAVPTQLAAITPGFHYRSLDFAVQTQWDEFEDLLAQ